jgi:glycosyltransferase involved in cell wall biosynthesis
VKVILLGNYLHDRQESMRRYADMLRELLRQADVTVELIRPEPRFGLIRPGGHGIGKWLGYIDKFILFPFALRSRLRREKSRMAKGGEPTLVHICDHSNAMYVKWLAPFPHVVTCHDLLAIQSARGLVPQNVTGWSGRLLQAWIASGLRRAGHVICVSDSTREDLLSLFPELRDRSRTVENALNHPYSRMEPDQADAILAALNLKCGRYLLHVGGNQWYKNRPGVIRILAELKRARPDFFTGATSLKLILAGQPPSLAMMQLMKDKELENDILFANDVSNDQLNALYSRAEALIFPSLREGFGWPLIEAQACGCPVVTGNRAPMNRVGGPAALFADPEKPADFVDPLTLLLDEKGEARSHHQHEALRHAANYAPGRFIGEMEAAYRSCLPRGPSRKA